LACSPDVTSVTAPGASGINIQARTDSAVNAEATESKMTITDRETSHESSMSGKEREALSDDLLDTVAAGINPQPLPPHDPTPRDF
jgi:hypothetical protein